MSRDALIERLLALPEELAAVEWELQAVEETRRRLQAALEQQETELLLSGAIDGKNEAIRAAQLRDQTASRREQLAACEQQVAREKVNLHQLQTEHASLRAIARLWAGAAD